MEFLYLNAFVCYNKGHEACLLLIKSGRGIYFEEDDIVECEWHTCLCR